MFSWNTFYWDQSAEVGRAKPPPTGTPQWEADGFYRYLRAQNVDVFLLQEYVYFGDDSLPIRVNDLDRLRREFPGYDVATVGELVTLSRFPIVARRGLDLGPWLEAGGGSPVPPGSRWPGFHTVKTLRTDLDVGGRTVSFYNTHINTPIDSSPPGLDPRRLNRTQHEARKANLRALAADVEANPLPAFVAGDFNASPAMGIMRLLPRRLTDAGPAIDSLYPATWDDRLPLWRIDWAFSTPGIAVHEYRIIPSEGQSDHSGQRLVISLTR